MIRIRPTLVLPPLTLLLLSCSGDEVSSPVGPNPPQDEIEWLLANAQTFDTPIVRDDRSDLAFLSDMVGGARIVSLGEATHGTREFFQIKHRILDYLVREKGFNLFAIEASWPEMNRIDDWVRGGEGDPAVLLSGQYFWTWRTQEVMDLILWAREYNQGRAPEDQVGVLGFDMQVPGMAIHNVVTFLEDTDVPLAETAVESYACYLPFANGPNGAFEQFDYLSRPLAERDACRARIDEAHTLLADNQSALVAASSQAGFDRALQSARLVQQNEDLRSDRVIAARDRYMAENVQWLLRQGGPGAKIVLWAHNFHVSTPSLPESTGVVPMGRFLRDAVGKDMVVFGFTFGTGSFRAITWIDAGTYGPLTVHSVGDPPPESYETVFQSIGLPRFMLDHRSLDLTIAGVSWWYHGPLLFRSIGASFAPGRGPKSGTIVQKVPLSYDVIIYFEESSPSVGLPFTPPTEF